jgi:hypothetical protein
MDHDPVEEIQLGDLQDVADGADPLTARALHGRADGKCQI